MGAIVKHVAIMVEDLEESVAFYQRVFDLDVVAAIDPGDEYKQRVVNMTDGHQAISLIQPTDHPYRPWEYETFGVNHIGFLVDSLDETLARLEKEPSVTGIVRFEVQGCPIAKFREMNGTEIDVADARYQVWMDCGAPTPAPTGRERHRIEPIDLSAADGPEPIAAQGAKGMDLMAVVMRNRPLYDVWRPLARHLIAHSALPIRLRELAILRTACVVRSEFEWGNHVLVARNAGLDDDEIAGVRDAPQSAERWSDLERAVLKVPDELRDDGVIHDATWQTLAAHLTDEQLVELLILAAHYFGVAFLANSAPIDRPEGVPDFATPPARP